MNEEKEQSVTMLEKKSKRAEYLKGAFKKMVSEVCKTKEVLKEEVSKVAEGDGGALANQLVDSKLLELEAQLLECFSNRCRVNDILNKLEEVDKHPEKICLGLEGESPEEIFTIKAIPILLEEAGKKENNTERLQRENRLLWKEIQEGKERNEKTYNKLVKIKEALERAFQKQPETKDLLCLKTKMENKNWL